MKKILGKPFLPPCLSFPTMKGDHCPRPASSECLFVPFSAAPSLRVAGEGHSVTCCGHTGGVEGSQTPDTLPGPPGCPWSQDFRATAQHGQPRAQGGLANPVPLYLWPWWAAASGRGCPALDLDRKLLCGFSCAFPPTSPGFRSCSVFVRREPRSTHALTHHLTRQTAHSRSVPARGPRPRLLYLGQGGQRCTAGDWH